MPLSVTWQHAEALQRFSGALKALGDRKAAQVESRAVNRTGDMARTQVRRTLTKQTGLPRKTIVAAVKTKRSSAATRSYRMDAAGGDVALRFFQPKETARGVSAKPFGKRKVFAHTFMRGGLFPNRKELNLGGHVFMPNLAKHGWGRPFTRQKSGVVIPAEMVKGATKEAFETTVERVLPQRIEHEIGRLTKGVVG